MTFEERNAEKDNLTRLLVCEFAPGSRVRDLLILATEHEISGDHAADLWRAIAKLLDELDGYSKAAEVARMLADTAGEAMRP